MYFLDIKDIKKKKLLVCNPIKHVEIMYILNLVGWVSKTGFACIYSGLLVQSWCNHNKHVCGEGKKTDGPNLDGFNTEIVCKMDDLSAVI